MLDRLEALRALSDTGTMGKAAARLRLTTSAVSKRIATLEREVGAPLLESDGRRVRLTPAARGLLEDVAPLLAALRERVTGFAPRPGTVRLAASESLLASWLPAILARSGLDLEIHGHRGPLVLERVRAGEVDLAIAAGGDDDPDLRAVLLGREPMVLVASSPPVGECAFSALEETSLTSRHLHRRVARLASRWGFHLVPGRRVEGFVPAVRLAQAGFGPALAPRGVAEVLGAPWIALPGLDRPIYAVARPRTWGRAEVTALAARISAAFPAG
jgi:DNA-binding transcriptional LysR family regulator